MMITKLQDLGKGRAVQKKIQDAWDNVNYAMQAGFSQTMVDMAIRRTRRLMKRYGVTEITPIIED